MPLDGYIVCQNEELKDPLDENVKGWHHYIKVDGDKRESHYYNTAVDTGYYENMIWERGKGLISYRSGYGALREAIELIWNAAGESSIYSLENLISVSEIVKREIVLRKPPEITYLGDSLLSIEIGVGTGTWLTQYYDVDKDIFSEMFESPITIQRDKIAYIKIFDNTYKLIVRNIFDKSKYYKEFNLDLSPVANPIDALVHLEYLNGDRLQITYLSGKDYVEKNSIFQL